MKQILFAALIMILLDGAFIYPMMNYWKNQIKLVQKTALKARIVPAIAAYLTMIFAWIYFIHIPHTKYKMTINESVVRAFALGFVIYAVFEFTNYALITNWKPLSVMFDTLWGATLYALVTLLTYKLIKV